VLDVRALLVGSAALLLAAAGSVSAAEEPLLTGTVGPGFTITLKDAAGNDVTSLPPGVYDVRINDLSDFHNFHLTGAGVDQATTVPFVGETTWDNVTLQAATTYTYVCDPHSFDMNGRFTTTGSPPPPPPPGPPPPGPPPPPQPPPPPPPSPPPPATSRVTVSGFAARVERRNGRRWVVARARLNRAAAGELRLLRRTRTMARMRKALRRGPNTLRLRVPARIQRGRYTARLTVAGRRYTTSIRL
jgi:hypothetical protein